MSPGYSATTILVVDSFSDGASLDLSVTTGQLSHQTVLNADGTQMDEAVRELDFTVISNPFFNDATLEVGERAAGGVAIYDTGPGVVSQFGVSYIPTSALNVSGSTGLSLDLLFMDRPMELMVVLVDDEGESFQTLNHPGGVFTSEELYFSLDDFSRSVDLEQVNEIRLFIDPDSSADFALDSFSFVAIPEPHTSLLLAGVAAFGFVRRRR